MREKSKVAYRKACRNLGMNEHRHRSMMFNLRTAIDRERDDLFINRQDGIDSYCFSRAGETRFCFRF
jgi:hypothetical protein